MPKLWFRAGELSYCVHRFPKRQHNKFDGIVQRVAKQVGSAMSFDGAQRRKHLRSGVPNVFVGFFNSLLRSPHSQDHAPSLAETILFPMLSSTV